MSIFIDKRVVYGPVGESIYRIAKKLYHSFVLSVTVREAEKGGTDHGNNLAKG